MVSRVPKGKASIRNRNHPLLRSITNYHSVINYSETSLSSLCLPAIFPRSVPSAVVPQCYWMRLGAYNVNLKQQLQYQLNQLEGETAQKIIDYDPMPMLKVEPQEEGFIIKVVSERSCQGLLVFILEAFEDLGLDVLQARVSCVDSFSLETVGVKENNHDTRYMDAQSVEKAVSQAIQRWKEIKEQ